MITYMFHRDSSCFIGGLGPTPRVWTEFPISNIFAGKRPPFLTSYALLTLRERLGPHVLAMFFLAFPSWLAKQFPHFVVEIPVSLFPPLPAATAPVAGDHNVGHETAGRSLRPRFGGPGQTSAGNPAL